MLNQKLTGQQAADKTYIEDVFSTYLYTGNGSTQTINNGIDLAGKGGMVWIKSRSGDYPTGSHQLSDTLRGAANVLFSNATNAQFYRPNGCTGFTSTGFSLGTEVTHNGTNTNYASWTFRKAPKFFDVVTYTGNGLARTISHNLGVTPGIIIIKCTSSSTQWIAYHRSLGKNYCLFLNTTDAAVNYSGYWNNTEPTSSVFSVGNSSDGGLDVNANGATYVAYLFAHDTTTDGLIQCGSYTGNGSASGPVVDLGREPQYVLVKKSSGLGSWGIMDVMRGASNTGARGLWANLSNAEVDMGQAIVIPTATGFKLATTGAEWNESGATYIYMAIRRGPMRTPTDGTKVFSPVAAGSAISTVRNIGFPTDLCISKGRSDGSYGSFFETRLIGFGKDAYTSANCLKPSSTAAEASTGNGSCIFNVTNTTATDGNFWDGYSTIWHHFRRAPGFFDVVCCTSASGNVNHNLGVTPELVIYKSRNTALDWFVFTQANGYLKLNLTNAIAGTGSGSGLGVNFANATATTINDGSHIAGDGYDYVAYLFASCPGVSKVGSYTGTGAQLDINCGFTNGARFVMIKRTDNLGNWWVMDTARGITADADPRLQLNSTSAEGTVTDMVDPYASGFSVTTTNSTAGATYIYLAIA